MLIMRYTFINTIMHSKWNYEIVNIRYCPFSQNVESNSDVFLLSTRMWGDIVRKWRHCEENGAHNGVSLYFELVSKCARHHPGNCHITIHTVAIIANICVLIPLHNAYHHMPWIIVADGRVERGVHCIIDVSLDLLRFKQYTFHAYLVLVIINWKLIYNNVRTSDRCTCL